MPGATPAMTGFDKNPLSSPFVEARKTTNDRSPAIVFGIPGERGLDAAVFDWLCITRAYLDFTREKLQSSRSGVFFAPALDWVGGQEG